MMSGQYGNLKMSNKKFTETVTIQREITGIIRDLCLFAHYLQDHNMMATSGTFDMNQDLIQAARDFWDREHGE